jgi:hypothetical protein
MSSYAQQKKEKNKDKSVIMELKNQDEAFLALMAAPLPARAKVAPRRKNAGPFGSAGVVCPVSAHRQQTPQDRVQLALKTLSCEGLGGRGAREAACILARIRCSYNNNISHLDTTQRNSSKDGSAGGVVPSRVLRARRLVAWAFRIKHIHSLSQRVFMAWLLSIPTKAAT